MIIAHYQVQNVLRAYGQRLSERTRLAAAPRPVKIVQKDEVLLSPEGKKKIVAEKIARQIFSQIVSGSAPQETRREALERLSTEFGARLEVSAREGNEVSFHALEGPAGTRILSPEESAGLKDRLVDITRSMVYSHMS